MCVCYTAKARPRRFKYRMYWSSLSFCLLPPFNTSYPNIHACLLHSLPLHTLSVIVALTF
jgi:hypothetical protein